MGINLFIRASAKVAQIKDVFRALSNMIGDFCEDS